MYWNCLPLLRLRTAVGWCVHCLYALFLFSVVCHTGRAASSRMLLDEAVQEYQAAMDCTDREQRLARFRRAELLFTRIAGGETTVCNADLFVNLGNAALGAERLGQAVLAYRRALMLDPDHGRARRNLAHVRTLLPQWVPRPEEEGWLDTFFARTTRLTYSEFQLLAALSFLLAAILFAASIRWRQAGLRLLAVIPACAWGLLIVVMLVLEGDSARPLAVVMVPEVVARSADSAGAPRQLSEPLPSGTELEILELRERWLHVRLFDGRDAWLPRSAVQLVAKTTAPS